MLIIEYTLLLNELLMKNKNVLLFGFLFNIRNWYFNYFVNLKDFWHL